MTKIFVESLGELVERRRNLQALPEDPLLPLDPDIERPFDEPGEILLRWEGSSNSELLRTLLEQRIRHLLDFPPRHCTWSPRTSLWSLQNKKKASINDNTKNSKCQRYGVFFKTKRKIGN